jgi:4-amino-4-deoxy-L-arabinose transferase-like glycosyltransferase
MPSGNATQDSDSRTAELLAALALGCVYLATMSGHFHSIDGLLVFQQARAILFDRSLTFDTPVLWGVPITTSRYGLGLSLLYIPGLVVWGWLQPYAPLPGGQPHDKALLYSDPVYVLAGAPVHLLITVVSAYLVARLCRELGLSRATALWGLAMYGLASPALVYARGDWSQSLVGLCWISALYMGIRWRRAGHRRDLLAFGTSIAYAVLARPVEGALLVPAALLLALPDAQHRRRRDIDWLAVAVVAISFTSGIVATLLVNYGRYGSPWTTGYEDQTWSTPLWEGLAGVLISPGRGMLLAFPAVLLSPLGVQWLWRAGQRVSTAALVSLTGLQVLNVATWHIWWGSWNWGLRLLLPALPILAVLAACGFHVLPETWRSWTTVALFSLGVLWAVPGVVTDLLGGYAGTYNGSRASFDWRAYPPIGAWEFLHHWRAVSSTDSNAVDILWLRVARATGNASLLPPLVFGLAALALASRAVSIAWGSVPRVTRAPAAVPEGDS